MEQLHSQQSSCSPKVNGNKNKSCLPYEMLVLIANMYNNNHVDKIDIVGKKYKKILHKALESKLKPQCGSDEACWIDLPFVRNSNARTKLEKNFKPEKPKSWYENPNEWLNTYDILNVMMQYEEGDKTYKFMGVFPVDFAAKNSSSGTCIVQDMCQINLAELWKKGIKKVGVVFNTDTSKGSGQHWISLFIGIDPKRKNYGVFFYDSVAMNPPREVTAFMKIMKSELEKLHPRHTNKIEYRVNKVRRQFKNSACGLYSMLFQILILKNKFDKVCQDMGFDDEVEKFRDILYRPSK